MHNNLEITGINIKAARYKTISKQFNIIKSVLCLQRGVRCYLSRKKRIAIQRENSALII